MEEILKHLKPFNLEEAKAGKPICTRDGRKARIICYDKKGDSDPIIALIENHLKDEEIIYHYNINGGIYTNMESIDDLCMLPEKHEGWVNVYKGIDGEITIGQYPYLTEETCRNVARKEDGYIGTTKVTWYD